MKGISLYWQADEKEFPAKRLLLSQDAQPEVDEKFINKWIHIWNDDFSEPEIDGLIREMLKEIPVRIKEKK